MSKMADSIRRGLEEAMTYAKGDAEAQGYRVHVPETIDVEVIRQRWAGPRKS